MVQKVIYGELSATSSNAVDLSGNVKMVLLVIALVIIIFGVYPQPMINLTKDSVAAIFLIK
jgi:NADH-quinone oxidoreductase subunit M